MLLRWPEVPEIVFWCVLVSAVVSSTKIRQFNVHSDLAICGTSAWKYLSFSLHWPSPWNAWKRSLFLSCSERSKRFFLFSPFGKLAGRAIYFTDVFSLFFYFFSGRPRSHAGSEANGPIFTKISGLVDNWKGLITPLSFFWFFKGRCHGNQLKSKNRSFLWENRIVFIFWRSYSNSEDFLTLLKRFFSCQLSRA